MFAGIDGGGGGEYIKGVFSVRGGCRGEFGIAMVLVGVLLLLMMNLFEEMLVKLDSGRE